MQFMHTDHQVPHSKGNPIFFVTVANVETNKHNEDVEIPCHSAQES